MKCSKHPDQEAIGLCVRCDRAVCPECLAKVDGRIVCRDRCEADVRLQDEYQRLVSRQSHAMLKAMGVGMGGIFAAMMLLSGGLLYRQGMILASRDLKTGGLLFLGLGLVLVISVIVIAVQKEPAPSRMRQRIR